MTLANDLEKIAVEALAQGAGAAVREFVEREPSAAAKAAAAKDLLKQALDLIPEEGLHPFLTADDAADAELVFRLARAAKLGGK